MFATHQDISQTEFETTYDVRDILILGDPAEVRRVETEAVTNGGAQDLFEKIEEQYGTLDIGGSGDDFLWGFSTTGETEQKDFDAVTDMVRAFFVETFGATLGPTAQVVTKGDPFG